MRYALVLALLLGCADNDKPKAPPKDKEGYRAPTVEESEKATPPNNIVGSPTMPREKTPPAMTCWQMKEPGKFECYMQVPGDVISLEITSLDGATMKTIN